MDKKIQHIPPLVFLDVETTGLSTQNGDRICEIAILRREKNGELVEWESLINPHRPISSGAMAVNRITDEMVQNAPCFDDVAKKIIGLIEGAIIVCHNASFDLSFLAMELAHCGITLPLVSIIDTLRISRQFFNFPSNCLGRIAESLNIEVEEKHRAKADVQTTYKIFTHFWSELNKNGIKRIEEITFQHI